MGTQANINSSLVPSAALIALLMKALQYVETEVMLNEDGTLIEGRPTEALSLIDCVMPDVVLARQKKLRERVAEEKSKLREKEAEEARKRPASESTAAAATAPDQKQVKVENGDNEQKMKGQDKKVNGIKPNSQPSEIDRLEPLTDVMIPTSRVKTLRGHESEVFICAWAPNADLLASGSGDSTARIWNLQSEDTIASDYAVPSDQKDNIMPYDDV